VKGEVKNSSVYDNASVHCGKDVVFTMDLEHCFASIGPERVKVIYQAVGFGQEATFVLTKLTTHRGELPQGVPTSTALANLALYRVDARISGLQQNHPFDYTRWVDDLTFSGTERILGLCNLFRRIVGGLSHQRD
jgi:RNA-directed DNA polymerase